MAFFKSALVRLNKAHTIYAMENYKIYKHQLSNPDNIILKKLNFTLSVVKTF